MVPVIGIIFFILAIGSIVFYLAGAVCTYQFSCQTERQQGTFTPPVTLMLPVCGLDAGAWENWSSFCQQNYPEYEILIGVTDNQDPAIPLLKKLLETFPDKIRLFTGLAAKGSNHKDSILTYLLEAAKHEHIVFADSDIQVNPHYLQTIIAPLVDPDVGLVTCAFVGRNPQSVGATLATFGRCFDFIPSALIARMLDGKVRFAIGATLATRKATLNSAGGLRLNRIGSDYNLGKRIATAGYKIILSHLILESDGGDETVGQVFRRELRWARTIRFNRGIQYYGMVFCFGSVYSVLLLLMSGWSGWAIAIFLLTWFVRYLQAFVSISCLKCPKLLFWLWLLPIRDLFSIVIWVLGAFGDRVYWRGRKLQIEGDGVIREVV